jgi:hypothetical protein
MRSFWRNSGLASKAAMTGLALSFAFFAVVTVGARFFSEQSSVPTGAPPGAEAGAATAGAIGTVVALVIQLAIVLGLRGRDTALQTMAAVAAVVGSMAVFFVAFFMAFDVIGGVPAWGWAAFLLLAGTGVAYFAAGIIAVALSTRGLLRHGT